MIRYLILSLLLFLFTGINVMAQEDNSSEETWSGKLDVRGIKLRLVFHLGGEKPTVDSPDQGAKGIHIMVEKPDESQIMIRIPSLGAQYKGEAKDNEITGTFTQGGMSFPLTLRPEEEKLNRPQTPQPPFPYSQEEVTFSNGDAVLKGTLLLPDGYGEETPVLLMVTGSGLQNRDEEIFEHKPFAVIADAFARSGIATLRYDDRGFGESTGNVVTATTEDFKNDAAAGIKLLRERFKKVGVLGHSEGGTIALMLGAERTPDFIISLAGMTVSGKETLIQQNKLALQKAGYREETVDNYINLLKQAFDAIIDGGKAPSSDSFELPAELKQNYNAVLMQLQLPYLAHFISLDMRPSLGEINIPVFALNGTKDTQVDYESNLEALKKGLPHNNRNKIETKEDLNHLFQHAKTGDASEYSEIEETFSPEVIDDMILWINSL